MTVCYNPIVDIKLEEVLLKGDKSKIPVQLEQPNLACRIILQNKSASQNRKRRVSTSMGCHEKGIVPEKKLSCLTEMEQKIQNCTKTAEGLREKHRRSLVKLGVQKKVKNITKKDGSSVVGLDSQNVTRSLQKTHSSSTLEVRPQEKKWNLRERTKPVWLEQKTCVNQDKRQRTKRRCLSNLECSMLSTNLQKGKGKSGVSCCKSKPQSPKNCTRNLEEARSSSVSHLSSGNCMEERKHIGKSFRLRLVKFQEPEMKTENCSVSLSRSKLPDGVEVQKQNSKCLLKCTANCEDSKKFQSITEEGIHRIVTRAFLKSKMCKNDGEKLRWKPKKSVSEISVYGQEVLKNNMVIEQMVDCSCTEELLDTRRGCSRKKLASGKEECVTSAELKKEIKASRVQNLEVSNKQHGKLAKTDKDCSVQNLLRESTCLPVPKLDETENKDCANLCFGKEVAIYYDAAASSVTNIECPEPLDIKVVGEKVENNPLAVYQVVKPRCLAEHCDLPCSVERFPVVRLLDCCYIKALLKPTGVKSIPCHKVHLGSLHVASSQGKVLSSSRDMGQNDLSNSPNLLQAERSLPQESILVEKEMCQNTKRSSRCRNRKHFRESKWCVDFKQPSKKIKISRDLEKLAIQKVLANMSIPTECGLQMEDKRATEDCPTVWGNLNYNDTCLSSVEHRADFLLEQLPQRPQNQLASLSCNEKVSEAHLITYDASDFEKALVLRKEEKVVEVKSMEPQINVDKKLKYDNSILKMLVSEKMISSNTNVGGCMKTKRKHKDKTVCKVRKNLQLYSCQRAVPISGKNVWPRESCARTSVWTHKNHVCDVERDFLKGTELLVNSGQGKSHKPLIGTSKTLADKIIDHKAELPTESCASESVFHVDKTFSAIGNGSKFSSSGKPNQCTSVTKTGKKLKMALDSLGKDVKNKRSIAKRSVSIHVQNGALASGKCKTNEQKITVTKKELLLQTLNPQNMSDFKIPLLKNKNESGKAEYSRSSERNTCCLFDILENSTISRNKTRAEQTSSDLNSKYQFQSEQINITISKEHANQFDSDFPESLYEGSNEHVETSNESELRTSTWGNSFDSLSTEFKEKQVLDSVLVPEIKDEGNSNNLAQVRDKYADVLQAYEDDILVIDVIQDDPDLFGDIDEQKAACTEKQCTKTNFNASVFSEQKVKLEPESPQLSGCRKSPVQDYGRLKSVTDLPSVEVGEIKSESPSEISSIGDATVSSVEDGQLTVLDDVTKSCVTNEKYKFPEKMLAVKEEKANIRNIAKIETTRYIEPVSHDHQLELLLPATKATAPQWQSTAVQPWMNDFRFSRKGPPLSTSHPNSHDSWKVAKNGVTNLGLLHIPRGYCRSYFNTLNGCERADCWYWHVPAPGNEKFCSEVLKKYIGIGEVVLLQRAVRIFTDYGKENIPRLHLNSQLLNDLLTSLLQSCLLKELFLVVHTSIMIKILPTVEVLLKVFEQVASMKLKDTVPDLIDISCKLVDAGMTLEYEHIGYITQFLNQLQISSQEITTFMSRFQGRRFKKASLYDFESAVAEFQHCKEKGDWAKLGTLYVNVRKGCGNADDLEKYSLCIANILTSVVKEEKPRVPFCEFAAAVNTDVHHCEADKNLLGRIGINVMFSYYRKQQWSKARKVLDALLALQIPFTFLKGLLGHERLASRCQIVNVAVEIFLKCGSLDGAIWVLKESEWVINTLSWPCDRMDVLTRHNLLCTMASEYIMKSRYGEAFEVLQNLPGFQNSCDTLDVSQYSLLFNKLLGACLESKHLGISSVVVEFMLTKNIPVEFNLLRALITSLGRSCLWLKARTHYKSALALGCYPPLEGNLYRKLLLIPSYMNEVEMLLAIEIFMVANASSIQSLGASSQILQIVLKRCEGNNVQKEDDYQNAVKRLIQAARISTPKLFIKHLTVNINKEQVYSLEYASVLKWLKENMKWAGKVWLF